MESPNNNPTKERWQEIVCTYESFASGLYGGHLTPMLEFVRRLACSPLAEVLSPGTSMYALGVSPLGFDQADFDRPGVWVELCSKSGKYRVTFADKRTNFCSAYALAEVFLEGIRRMLGLADYPVPIAELAAPGYVGERKDGWRTIQFDSGKVEETNVYWSETEVEWLVRPEERAFGWLHDDIISRKEWLCYCVWQPPILRRLSCHCALELLRGINWQAEKWPFLSSQTDPPESGTGSVSCPDKPNCQAYQILRSWRLYSRAILTWHELKNKCVEASWLSDPDQANWKSIWKPLLHEVYGNPFRPVSIDASWLRWNDSMVPKLARFVYDQRKFEDLPILADALKKAGCTNAQILDHCHSPGPHVRGCWIVDLLLQ